MDFFWAEVMAELQWQARILGRLVSEPDDAAEVEDTENIEMDTL